MKIYIKFEDSKAQGTLLILKTFFSLTKFLKHESGDFFSPVLDNKKLNGADQHTEAIQFSTVFVQIHTIENRNKGQYVLYKTEERGRPDIKDIRLLF